MHEVVRAKLGKEIVGARGDIVTEEIEGGSDLAHRQQAG
jgi:hypothetical protein